MNIKFAAAAVFLMAPTLVHAQPAPAAAVVVKSGQILRSADGKRIGRVENVRTTGGVATAQIIFNSRFISVPVSTISAPDRKLMTSLTYDQIKGL